MKEADVAFDELDYVQMSSPSGELPYFQAYHRNPLRIPSYVKILRKGLLSRTDQMEELTMYSAFQLGSGSRRIDLADRLKKIHAESAKPEGLFESLKRIHALGERPLTTTQSIRLKSEIAKLPADIREKTAFLLELSRVAIGVTRTELKRIGITGKTRDITSQLVWNYEVAKSQAMLPIPADLEAAASSFSFNRVFAAYLDVIRGVDDVEKSMRDSRPIATLNWDWETPFGRVSVHGTGRDEYVSEKPSLLILDTGGNDTYYSGASADGSVNPISILIDANGDDRYLGDRELATTPIEKWKNRTGNKIRRGFGTGVFGLGLIADSSGNDLYRTTSDSLGRGIFGIGLIHDVRGNDVYDCYAHCLGSADFGIGSVIEGGGSDRYTSFMLSQGYAGPHAWGMLLDAGVDPDEYAANDQVRDLQFKAGTEHNMNLSQGVSSGWRGDLSDGRSFAGGVGVLIDEGGDNRFGAGIMAQGMGYWHGLGILSSGKGNDSYLGDYYAQGTAVHSGAGVLHDEGGNDRYQVTEYQAMGSSRDLSTAFLWDESGDDVYDAPPYSIGFGDTSGMGLFWDERGNDLYRSKSSDVIGAVRCIGSEVLNQRSRISSVGLFLDSEGSNRYETPRKDVKSGGRWSNYVPAADPRLPGCRGFGQDL